MSSLTSIDTFSSSEELVKNILFLSPHNVNDSIYEHSVRGDVAHTSKLHLIELAVVLTVGYEIHILLC